MVLSCWLQLNHVKSSFSCCIIRVSKLCLKMIWLHFSVCMYDNDIPGSILKMKWSAFHQWYRTLFIWLLYADKKKKKNPTTVTKYHFKTSCHDNCVLSLWYFYWFLTNFIWEFHISVEINFTVIKSLLYCAFFLAIFTLIWYFGREMLTEPTTELGKKFSCKDNFKELFNF